MYLDPLYMMTQHVRKLCHSHKCKRMIPCRQLLVALAEWLCAHHRSDARAGRIVADMHLHLLPTMNPDGYACRFFTCKYCTMQLFHKLLH